MERQKFHVLDKYIQLFKLSKAEGGLGFKDLKAMNLALFAKQCWRLLASQNSLFYKVFRGKYFKFGDVLTAEIESNPSWAW